MFGSLPAHFTREMGCTEAEWLGWLPGACRGAPLALHAAQATVHVGPSEATGRLHLQWQVLPPRRIALVTLPRLAVTFSFDGVSPDDQAAFMRYFDLYMQRGGG
jgi:hypothetical protein